MVCPFCSEEDTAVIDSRRNAEGSSVRRRRKCSKCDFIFQKIKSDVTCGDTDPPD